MYRIRMFRPKIHEGLLLLVSFPRFFNITRYSCRHQFQLCQRSLTSPTLVLTNISLPILKTLGMAISDLEKAIKVTKEFEATRTDKEDFTQMEK